MHTRSRPRALRVTRPARSSTPRCFDVLRLTHSSLGLNELGPRARYCWLKRSPKRRMRFPRCAGSRGCLSRCAPADTGPGRSVPRRRHCREWVPVRTETSAPRFSTVPHRVADSGGGCRVRAQVMHSRAIVPFRSRRSAHVSTSHRLSRTLELCSGGEWSLDFRVCSRRRERRWRSSTGRSA